MSVQSDTMTVEEVKSKVQEIHQRIQATCQQIGSMRAHSYTTSSPMISKIISSIIELKDSIDIIFSNLSVKLQEEYSWLVLNASKLIYDLGQPLIWIKCGKFVANSFLYAAIAMESIINLTTARHLKFRMKLLISAFYAYISDETGYEQAMSIISYTSKQISDLKQREELDLPIPVDVLSSLIESEMDLAVLRACATFQKSYDSLNILTPSFEESCKVPKYLNQGITAESLEKLSSKSFIERVVVECCRIQHMSSWNRSDVWRRKCSILIDIVMKKLNDKSYDGSLSVNCLTEIASLLVLDDISGSSSDKTTVLDALVTAAENKILTSPSDQSLDYMNVLKLVSSIEVIDEREIRLPNPNDLESLLRTMTKITNENAVSNIRRCFIRKGITAIWSKHVYKALQWILSKSSSEAITETAISIHPFLNMIVKSLGFIYFDDMIMNASIACATGLVMKELKRYRDGISLLQRALATLEDYRALDVDIELICPDKVTEYQYIQRLSFSLGHDSISWYESIANGPNESSVAAPSTSPRIHIYSQKADKERISQALAEFQTDLIVLYFRMELEYALVRVSSRETHARDLIANSKDPLDQTKTRSTDAIKSSKSQLSQSKSKMKIETGKETETAEAAKAIRSVEDFGYTIKSLKAYCCKNPYARALLYLELARFEVQYNHQKAFEYVKTARECIEEAEAKEIELVNAFNMTQDISHDTFPIILARSHSSIFVSPRVAATSDIVACYRIFAREAGSGTKISMSNILSGAGYKGCEKSITIVKGKPNPVKIEGLRCGERYVFSSVAYDRHNDPIESSLSDTSPAIAALNPLPIFALWSLLAKTSSELFLSRSIVQPLSQQTGSHITPLFMIQAASKKLFDRYFKREDQSILSIKRNKGRDYYPKESIARQGHLMRLSLGHGVNVIVGGEPNLSIDSIKQSSPYMLILFIQTYLIYLEHSLFPSLGNMASHSNVHHYQSNLAYQELMMYHIQNISIVSIISSSIQNYELTCRCVLCGYCLISRIYLYPDGLSYFPSLQSSIMNLIISLQSTNKIYWHELEYNMYCMLYNYLIRGSVRGKQTQMALNLLQDFHFASQTGSLDILSDVYTMRSKVSVMSMSLKTQSQYLSLYAAIDQIGGGVMGKYASTAWASVSERMSELFKIKDTPTDAKLTKDATKSAVAGPGLAYLWAMERVPRLYCVQTNLRAIITSILGSENVSMSNELQLIDKSLRDIPRQMSDLLHVVSVLLKEVTNSDGLHGKSSKQAKVAKLLRIIQAYDKYLSSHAQTVCKVFQLSFIRQATVIPESSDDKPSAGKSKTAAKQATNNALPSNGITISSIPDRIVQSSQDAGEVYLQMRYLAECAAVLGNACFSASYQRRHPTAVRDEGGPYQPIDLHQVDSESIVKTRLSAMTSGERSEDASQGTTDDLTPFQDDNIVLEEFPSNGILSKVEYIRYMIASMQIFASTSSISSAVAVAVRLWSFIIDEWVSPYEFVQTYQSLRVFIRQAMISLCILIADITAMITNEPAVYPSSIASEKAKEHNIFAIHSSEVADRDSMMYHLIEESKAISKRSLHGFLLSLRDISWYFLSCMFLLDYHDEVVDLGSNTLQSLTIASLCEGYTISTSSTTLFDHSKCFNDVAMPLILYSHNKILLSYYRQVLDIKQEKLNQYVKNYEMECLNMRKKKPRIARGKSEEEIRFEEERDRLMGFVLLAEKDLKDYEMKYEILLDMEKNYMNYYPSGYILYDKLKRLTNEFLSDCQSLLSHHLATKDPAKAIEDSSKGQIQGEDERDKMTIYEDCLEDDVSLLDRFDGLHLQYSKLFHYLREKKMKSLLLECLIFYGDMLLLFLPSKPSNRIARDKFGATSSRTAKLRNIWRDAVDGVFSCLDSHLEGNWKAIYQRLTAHQAASSSQSKASEEFQEIQSCLLPTVSVLGRLLRYTSHNDFDQRCQYSRIIADLFHVLCVNDSIFHPLELHRYAAYELSHSVGGELAQILRRDSLSGQALYLAAEDAIHTLQMYGNHVITLPIYAMMEYYCGAILQNASKWLEMRIYRIHSLIALNYFAEAASMIAGIKPNIQAIYNHVYDNKIGMKRGQGCHDMANLIDPASSASNQGNNPPVPISRGPSVPSSKGLNTKQESNRNMNIPKPSGAKEDCPYDLAVNGFDFYGQRPYFNHLPPESTENMKALEWIKSYPNELKGFLSSFKHPKAANELTEEERESLDVSSFDDDKRSKAGAIPTTKNSGAMVNPNDSNSAKKGGIKPKGNDSQAVSTMGSDKTISVAAFGVKYDRLISHICGKFVLQLCLLDSHRNRPNALATTARAIYDAVLSSLAASSKDIDNFLRLTDKLQNIYPASPINATSDVSVSSKAKGSAAAAGQGKGFVGVEQRDNSLSPHISLAYLLKPHNLRLFSYSQQAMIKIYLQSGQYREIRALCSKTLQFLSSFDELCDRLHVNHGHRHPLSRSICWNIRLEMLYYLALVSFKQARVDESLQLVHQSLSVDVFSCLHSHWMKQFILLRCEIYSSMRDYVNAERDVRVILDRYEQPMEEAKMSSGAMRLQASSISQRSPSKGKNRIAMDHAQAIELRSTILRDESGIDMAYYQAILLEVKLMIARCNYLDRESIMDANFIIIQRLLYGYYILRTIAHREGFLGYEMALSREIASYETILQGLPTSNADSDESKGPAYDLPPYKDIWTRISLFDRLKPWKMHCDSQKTSITAIVSNLFLSRDSILDSNTIPGQRDVVQSIWQHELVSEGAFSQHHCISPYINNYNEAVKHIVDIKALICMVLDEIASNNYFDAVSTYTIPSGSSIACQYLKAVLNREDESCDDMVSRKLESSDEMALTREDFTQLRYQMSIDGILCLRHTYHSSASSRCQLLMAFGKAQIHRLTAQDNLSNQSSNQLYGKTIIKPFLSAFAMISNRFPAMALMDKMCLQLIECYGNNAVTWNHDKSSHDTNALKLTVKIMQMTIKLRQIHQSIVLISESTVKSSSMALGLNAEELIAHDVALAAILPEEVALVVRQLYAKIEPTDTAVRADRRRSSAFTNKTNNRKTSPLKTRNEPSSHDIKASDAAPVNANANITIQEALELLSYLVLEADNSLISWDYTVFGVIEDIERLHELLRKHVPHFDSTYCLQSLPTLNNDANNDALAVGLSSVSILWSRTSSPISFDGDAIVKALGEAYAVKGSSYQHIAGYFLLGASVPFIPPSLTQNNNPAPAVKGNKPLKAGQSTKIAPQTAVSVPVTTEEPIITKLILYEPEMVFIRYKVEEILKSFQSLLAMRPLAPMIAPVTQSPVKGKGKSALSEQAAQQLAQQQSEQLEQQRLLQQEYDIKLLEYNTAMSKIAADFSHVLSMVIDMISKGHLDLSFDTSNPNKRYNDLSISEFMKYVSNPVAIMSVMNASSCQGNELDLAIVDSLGALSGNVIKIDIPRHSENMDVNTSHGNQSSLSCYVALNDSTINSVATIMNYRKDVDSLPDNSICILLRSILGYGSK